MYICCTTGQAIVLSIGTGTGKTLSFVLPILERMAVEGSIRSGRGRPPCTLVMAPTRELANQVDACMCTFMCMYIYVMKVHKVCLEANILCMSY